MDRKWMETIGLDMQVALEEKFGIEPVKLTGIVASGQNSLTAGMKTFVMKHGSGEIEAILLKQKDFSGSKLQSFVVKQLGSDLSAAHGMAETQASEIAGFSADYLVKRIVNAFQEADVSKDLDGICVFIGIDKNLLKMVNSPVGKMFGKFF